MQHRHWTPDHRDAVLRRVSAVTVGTAVIGAAGAFGLGFGMVSAASAADAAKAGTSGGVQNVAAAPSGTATHAPTAKKSAAKSTATNAAPTKKAAAATKKAWTPPPAPPAPAPAPTKAAATSGGS